MITKKLLKKLFGFLLDILFPRRCIWCGEVVGFAKECDCKPDISKLQLPAQPLNLHKNGQKDEHLVAAWACFEYISPVKDVILRLKFKEKIHNATPLGQLMAAKASACGLQNRFDAVIPVPVSAETIKKRGYNQAALLAQVVSEETGIPCLTGILVKQKETRQQMSLSREERKSNVIGAYAVTGAGLIEGKRILLVDDVITTGATLDECAKTLLSAAAGECGAFCAASVVRKN